jgi:RimJ/RimL family protein N-acetyltransferase
MEPVFLETEHLTLATATERDLPALVEVYTSNPDYVSVMEGPDGYSLAKLQRDWHVAGVTGRTMLTIRCKQDGAPIGTAEFLDENPSDGHPWLGLLLIRGDLQGQGYGSEALDVLLDYFGKERCWPIVRLAVKQQDQRAMRFWQRHGFTPFKTIIQRLAGGETKIVCMQRTCVME